MADITKLRLSGQTYNIKDESALHQLDNTVTSGGTNAVNGAGIYNAIEAALQSVADQHYQTSGDVENAISGKADTTAVTQSINEAVSGKADVASAVTNVSIEVGQSNNLLFKKTINGNTTSAGVIDGGNGIIVEAPGGSTRPQIKIDTTVVAQKTDIPAVSGYADAVKYNSTSKYVEFYHGGTGGTKVFEYDASPFLIDGMVDNVEVKDVTLSGESVTCLVITFNTDAGKQEIDIPISEIFDASNYYTKAETDAALSGKADTATTYTKTETDNKIDEKIAEAGGMTSGAVQSMIDSSISGKADTTAVTEALTAKTDNSSFTAHTADTTVHVTTAEKNTWNAKANVSDIPTSNSELTNDKKYVYLTLDGETLVFNT